MIASAACRSAPKDFSSGRPSNDSINVRLALARAATSPCVGPRDWRRPSSTTDPVVITMPATATAAIVTETIANATAVMTAAAASSGNELRRSRFSTASESDMIRVRRSLERSSAT